MTSLQKLTQKIVETRAQRGFVTDPLKIQLLLTEEIGEISAVLKRTWSANYAPFAKKDLAEEIADAFALLIALADQFDIDIAEAIEKKFFEKDTNRIWKTAK